MTQVHTVLKLLVANAGMLSSSDTRTRHAAWDTWYNFAWRQQEKRRQVTLADDHCQYRLWSDALNAFRCLLCPQPLCNTMQPSEKLPSC